MKKMIFLAIVAVFALTAVAQASSVSFSWGACFTNWANTNIQMSVGQAGQLEWYADDFGFGVRNEAKTFTVMNSIVVADNVSEIIVDKWLSKSVAVGLGMGSGSGVVISGPSYSMTLPVVDVRGTVQLLSGKGEKVNASLDFNLAARWVGGEMPGGLGSLNSTTATLAVTLGL